ncbi:hypothetical protein [Prevotella sp.]|uniref:hypothetical protein n=1 Tax=Prevotella sp. TaxID=59823 RepID=UPI0040293EBD
MEREDAGRVLPDSGGGVCDGGGKIHGRALPGQKRVQMLDGLCGAEETRRCAVHGAKGAAGE